MTPEQFRKAESVFLAACALPGEKRDAFIREQCGADAELLAQVRKLLAQDSRHDLPLDAPVGRALRRFGEDIYQQVTAASTTPGRIGAYRVVRILGEGGMGVVYEAEQESPRRSVAIKVLRSGTDGSSLERRFEHEAHILGRLSHPGIAQIIEAGRDETAGYTRLYLVMELICGRDLIRYAESEQLDDRHRIELFVRVCDAVHYAHQKGVIHRDLKPANILVAEPGSDRVRSGVKVGTAASTSHHLSSAVQPKVLDFGVARLVDSDSPLTVVRTQAGQWIGTLAYMSPEQVSGDPDEIDVRSDVYALGVLLYELLAGHAPIDVVNVPLTEAARRIREQEPTRIGTIHRRLRGDIETILNTALAKEKSRRYQSAAALADDLRAYLQNEPISAQRDSAFYQLRKNLRRYRSFVGASSVIALLMVAFGVYMSIQSGRFQRLAQDERIAREAAQVVTRTALDLQSRAERATEDARYEAEQARRESLKARRIAEFLQQTLIAADPRTAGDRNLRVGDVLAAAAARIEDQLWNEPAVRASILTTIGRSYIGIGDRRTAENFLVRAIDLYRQTPDAPEAERAEAASTLGAIYIESGRLEEGEEWICEALEIHRRVHGDDSYAVSVDLVHLAGALLAMGRLGDAEFHAREALHIRRSMTTEIYETGDPHDELSALNSLVRILHQQRKFAEAELLLREAVAFSRDRLGPGHPITAASVGNLGSVLAAQGRLDLAVAYQREALELARFANGEVHPDVGQALNNLANTLMQLRNYEASEEVFREALRIMRETSPAGDLNIASVLSGLGASLLSMRRGAEAEPYLRESLEIRRRGSPNHFLTFWVQSRLGESLNQQRRYAEAEPLLVEALERLRKALRESDWMVRTTMHRLADVYEATERAELAAPLRASAGPRE